MGKASKWFRGLLGLSKKPTDPSSSSSFSQSGPSPNPTQKPGKKKWSFVKSYKEKDHYYVNNVNPTETSQHGVKLTIQNDVGGVDPNKHAIAVAAATAAVAEAAVAAAHAAAAVVRLTSSGRATTAASPTTCAASENVAVGGCGGGGGSNSWVQVSGKGGGYGSRGLWAAVKIQSHFRAYLSRRALRALKALVKLQALVRGHIVRKQTADMIRRMQALLRVQARARAGRSQNFESPLSASKYMHPDPATPEKFEHVIQGRSLKYEGSIMLKRNGSKSNSKTISDQSRSHIWEQQGSSVRSGPIDDRRSDKILEVDNGKPQITPKRRNLFHSSHLSLGSEQYSHSFTTSKESTAHQSFPSPSSYEVQSFGPVKFTQDLDDGCYFTADSSPQFYSTSSKCDGSAKKGPFTPTKSDGSRSCLSGYSDHPNYMSVTESSKAKIRSLSAPKQRPHYDRSSSTKRYSIHDFNDSRVNAQRASALHANFTNKAYPGSGRLDRLGMPIGGDAVGFSGDHWHRF